MLKITVVKTGIAASAAVAFGIIMPFSAIGAGIQASPPRLEITAQKTVKTRLTVANPTADVQLFTISADDFKDAIGLKPESVTIEAGGRKEIEITVWPEKLPKGSPAIYETAISVVSRPLADNKVRVGTGIKIPIFIRVVSTGRHGMGPMEYAAAAGLLAIVAAITVAARKRLKRRT